VNVPGLGVKAIGTAVGGVLCFDQFNDFCKRVLFWIHNRPFKKRAGSWLDARKWG